MCNTLFSCEVAQRIIRFLTEMECRPEWHKTRKIGHDNGTIIHDDSSKSLQKLSIPIVKPFLNKMTHTIAFLTADLVFQFF